MFSIARRGYSCIEKNYFLGNFFSLARFSNASIALKVADVKVTATMVLMNIMFSLFSYSFGLISDHIKLTMLLMVGLILLIFSDLVFASADTPYGILLGVILFGLHLGATQGIFATLVASVADSDRRATAFGLFNFFSGIALLVAGVFAGFLWEYYGACYSFLGGALFAFAVLIVCLWLETRH